MDLAWIQDLDEEYQYLCPSDELAPANLIKHRCLILDADRGSHGHEAVPAIIRGCHLVGGPASSKPCCCSRTG